MAVTVQTAHFSFYDRKAEAFQHIFLPLAFKLFCREKDILRWTKRPSKFNPSHSAKKKLIVPQTFHLFLARSELSFFFPFPFWNKQGISKGSLPSSQESHWRSPLGLRSSPFSKRFYDTNDKCFLTGKNSQWLNLEALPLYILPHMFTPPPPPVVALNGFCGFSPLSLLGAVKLLSHTAALSNSKAFALVVPTK